MTKVTDPIKLEEARARMAKARAARASMKHPDSVNQRVRHCSTACGTSVH